VDVLEGNVLLGPVVLEAPGRLGGEAEELLERGRSSSTCPTRMRVVITAAASK
jgi:hypothetical protein